MFERVPVFADTRFSLYFNQSLECLPATRRREFFGHP
jgi:hypothetical protein